MEVVFERCFANVLVFLSYDDIKHAEAASARSKRQVKQAEAYKTLCARKDYFSKAITHALVIESSQWWTTRNVNEWNWKTCFREMKEWRRQRKYLGTKFPIEERWGVYVERISAFDLKTCDLSGLNFVQNPTLPIKNQFSSFHTLSRIKRLDLSFCSFLRDVKDIAAMPNLQCLYLLECRKLKDIRPLIASESIVYVCVAETGIGDALEKNAQLKAWRAKPGLRVDATISDMGDFICSLFLDDSTIDRFETSLSVLPKNRKLKWMSLLASCVRGVRRVLSVDGNKMQGYVDALIRENDDFLSVVVKLMEYDVDAVEAREMPALNKLATEIRFESAWIATNIASSTTEHCDALASAGAVRAFERQVDDPSFPVYDQAIWGLGNIAGDCAKLRDEVFFVSESKVFERVLGKLEPFMKPDLAKIDVPKRKVRHLETILWMLCNSMKFRPYPPFDRIITLVKYMLWFIRDAVTRHEILHEASWGLSFLTNQGDDATIDRLVAMPGFLEATIRRARIMLHRIVSEDMKKSKEEDGAAKTKDDDEKDEAAKTKDDDEKDEAAKKKDDDETDEAVKKKNEEEKAEVRRKTLEIVRPLLRTLGNIISGSDGATEKCVQAGAVDLYKTMLIVPQLNMRLLKEVAWAISNLSATNGTDKASSVFAAKSIAHILTDKELLLRMRALLESTRPGGSQVPISYGMPIRREAAFFFVNALYLISKTEFEETSVIFEMFIEEDVFACIAKHVLFEGAGAVQAPRPMTGPGEVQKQAVEYLGVLAELIAKFGNGADNSEIAKIAQCTRSAFLAQLGYGEKNWTEKSRKFYDTTTNLGVLHASFQKLVAKLERSLKAVETHIKDSNEAQRSAKKSDTTKPDDKTKTGNSEA
eukprot:g2069.t1